LAADDCADLLESEPEPCGHPEVAASAPDRPEQVGVRLGVDLQETAVGGDDLGGRESMVRPCFRTRKPMPPPSVIPPRPTDPVSPNPVARP